MNSLDDIKKILCPYDFTPACEVSLAASVGLARRLGAALHVLHVVVTPPMVVLTPSETFPTPPVDQTGFVEAVKAKRTPEIEAVIGRSGAPAPPATIVFEEGLHADLAIADYAERASISLVVMAKHARGSISRLLIGSTTERVLRHAKCPVLVIPVGEPKRNP